MNEINAVVNNLDQYIQSNFSHIYKATILIYKRGSMRGGTGKGRSQQDLVRGKTIEKQ